MRDWFSASALYNPLWIVAGTVMGLWGTGMSTWVGTVWVIIGLAVALLAWRASAHQAREGRLISENLGKLVSVTEPSPANILAAAGAKILTLEHAQDELKSNIGELKQELDATKAHQRRELTPKQRIALKSAIDAIQTQHGLDSLRFPLAYNHMVGEAGEFAGQLHEVLFPCGVSYESPVPTDDVPLDFEGLALVVKDRYSPPVRAKLFMTALQGAELPVRFETLTGRRATLNISDEYCEFVVGRRESIGAIERQLAKLQVQQDARWQSLSEQQRADFVAALKELQIDRGGPTVMIFPDFTRHDSVELSHTFGRLCAEANWNAPTFSHAIGKGVECPPGLNIYADASRPDVQTFMKGLERAKIPYDLKTEYRVGVFEVRIGRRTI